MALLTTHLSCFNSYPKQPYYCRLRRQVRTESKYEPTHFQVFLYVSTRYYITSLFIESIYTIFDQIVYDHIRFITHISRGVDFNA